MQTRLHTATRAGRGPRSPSRVYRALLLLGSMLLLSSPALAQAGLTNVALKSKGATALALDVGVEGDATQYADYAIDGEHRMGWGACLTPTMTLSVWLEVALPRSYQVEGIGVLWRHHEHTYTVDVSENGVWWYQLIGYEHSPNVHGSAPVYDYHALSRRPAKFVRLNLWSTCCPLGDPLTCGVFDLEVFVRDCDGDGVPDVDELDGGTATDANGNGVPDACECEVYAYGPTSPNSTGAHARIGYDGGTSIAADDFVLTAEGCPQLVPGVFFYGPDQVLLPFGDGWRLVGGAITRLAVTATDGAGQAAFALDLAAPPLAGDVSPFAATNFQFWFRDPASSGAPFNTTDALSVTFCP